MLRRCAPRNDERGWQIRTKTFLPSRLSVQLTTVWLLGLAVLSPHTAHAREHLQPSAFVAALPQPASLPRAADGAIFDAGAGYVALYEGTRARRVGDAVTILLAESTTSDKSVSAKSAKGGKAAITPPTRGLLSILKADALKASSDSSFNGNGSAVQTSRLSTTLAVTIAEVRANGTALVRGEKRMLLSQGDEWVRFSGIVRLSDIDEDNTVPSSRIADAHIEYSGKGALQRASRQGWLGRLFNIVSPF